MFASLDDDDDEFMWDFFAETTINRQTNDSPVKIDRRRGTKRPNLDHRGRKIPRNDYKMSQWRNMLQRDAEALQIPGTKPAKLFRLRFRVPYSLFLKLVEWTREWYEIDETYAVGKPCVPLELKVLSGVLRILGRSTCLDGINELSGISIPCMRIPSHLRSHGIYTCLHSRILWRLQ